MLQFGVRGASPHGHALVDAYKRKLFKTHESAKEERGEMAGGGSRGEKENEGEGMTGKSRANSKALKKERWAQSEAFVEDG